MAQRLLLANANSVEAPSVHEPLVPDNMCTEYVLNPFDRKKCALCALRLRNLSALWSTEQLAAYAWSFALREYALHGFVNDGIDINVL